MRNRGPIRVRSDLSYLAILILLSLGIGIWFILTTVLIAEDGAAYIESAKNFLHIPAGIKREKTVGYSFLIFLAHETMKFFGSNDSIRQWIYTAQSVTLLCRTLCLIPLYYIGKMLVGPRRSFWGVLVLVLLPDPAEVGSDVLRDWPHLLFLASGIAFLMYASGKHRWGLFAAAGLTAGFGYMIRPECAQIVFYGLLWLFLGLLIPRPRMGRLKSLGLIVILLIGFCIPWVPYMKMKGGALPVKLRVLISSHLSAPSGESRDGGPESDRAVCAGPRFPGELLRAFGKLAGQTSANLNYYFVLPWAAGLFCRFRKIRTVWPADTFFIAALAGLYIVMLSLLEIRYHYISKRHCLPLVVFTIFYIPVGLQWMAYVLNKKLVPGRIAGTRIRQRWVWILLGIGIVFCIGRLTRLIPMRADKQGYRQAAAWLKTHTRPDELIVFPFPIRRIGLYAERSMADSQLRTSTISAGSLREGIWYHLTGTFDGCDQKLYIDGRLAAEKRTDLGGLGAGNNTFAIGKPSAKSDLFYEGRIDRVRLYGKALSPEEIDPLVHGREVSREAEGDQIGSWSLSSDGSRTADKRKTFLDLSGIMAGRTIDELTISVIIQPVFLESMNWIAGNQGQFCLGVRNSEAFFEICEPRPGSILPAEADYVVVAAKGPAPEISKRFDKSLEAVYSVWSNPKQETEKIIIYRVIP